MFSTINSILDAVDGFVWGIPLIVLILATGVLLTVRLKGMQFSKLGLALKSIFREPDGENGEVSSFKALCTALSYTKTAEILHLTQPAVSQHIHGLEKELGIVIFNRTENGLKPTPQGIIAIRYAKRIQALYELEKTRIEDSKKNMFSFTIGITHTSESSGVSNALAEYAYSTAGLHITIISDDIINLYTKLENYEIDLAIVEARNTDPRYRSVLLDTDSLMLAVSATNPLAKKSVVTIEELKKQKMILRSEE